MNSLPAKPRPFTFLRTARTTTWHGRSGPDFSTRRRQAQRGGTAACFKAILNGLVALFLLAPLRAAPFEWQTASPESQGVSPDHLEIIRQRMADKGTRAFLVIRHDHIVCEWYAPGVTATAKQGTASLAKALVGGMSLAVAMQDGKISIDDPASKFIPQWKDDPRKSKILVRHLGSHTSGLSDAETDGVKHEEQLGWKGEFWRRLDPPHDPFTLGRDATPMLFDPGTKFQYSNPGIGLMTYCTTAAIRDGKIQDIRTLLRDRLFRPIGITDNEWSVGYGQTFTVDGLPLVCSWGGAAFTPRAAARLGRLVLRDGNWDGATLLRPDVVRQVTTDAGLPTHCGMGWWTNGDGRYAKLPKDAVWGAGAGDQLVLVVPSLDLIMVRNGIELVPGRGEPPVAKGDPAGRDLDYRAHILFEPLAETIVDRDPPREGFTPKRSDPPYPPSPVIREVKWAPKICIVRHAKGSDNWPLTWADDDRQYTAYGDGNGFEPFVPEKLSLGLAVVTGTPSEMVGTNLRAPTAEMKGQGPAGRKASGILMVQGTLYLWTRNAGGAQLASSKDHGATWTWADWKFTEGFGCPTFLNFGRNYAGARDEFVYLYSPDSMSAYTAADRMLLARVPMTKILDRSAYEFLHCFDQNGQPTWTPALAERGAVFTHPGNCYRSGITYDAALKRYLWCQILPGSTHPEGPRFQGGFGIYDAPEPWGPWTTAFFTPAWDVGPGETSSFPTKWMSSDGTTLHLVFSGEDSFSIRQAAVQLYDQTAH